MSSINFKHSDITQKIIGCAMSVHCKLGNGFQEVVYQRALAIEPEEAKLNFSREDETPIIYKDQQIGTRRVDFFVENKILVEIKAITQLDNVHLAQGKNYLEAYNIENGLLINFGAKSLEFKRLFSKQRLNQDSQD